MQGLEIVLVLKSGGDFGVNDVKAITRALRENAGYPGPVTCLTDIPEQVEPYAKPIQLVYPEWWGWWAKIERFRPGLFDGPVLYFDLDTIILGGIEQLVELVETTPQPMMLESRKHPGYLASGIGSWWGDQMADVYDSFIEKPMEYIQEHNQMQLGWRGPQGFVRRCISPLYLQNYLPKNYIMFKRDYRRASNPDCRVVAWSGKPRIPNCTDRYVREYWEKFSS